LNARVNERLEDWARQHGIAVAGRVPYDSAVPRAQLARLSASDMSDRPARQRPDGAFQNDQ